MSGDNPGNQTFMQRMMALVGHSAEYSIAFALLAVCLVVGVAIWLLQPSAPVAQGNSAAQTSSANAMDAKSADEQAALGAWKQKLEGGFDQMDQKQRRNEEERNRQDEQRQEAEAEARVRRKVQQTTAASMPATTARAIESTPPVSFTPKVALKAAPVRVDAAIDWTSCKRPAYPEASMRKNEQGVVVVDVDLDENAKILGSRVSQSSGFERLDTTTKTAIGKCRFHAATSDGLPVAATAVVRFTWALSK